MASPFILRLPIELYDVSVRFPKLDLMEIVAEVPEFSALGLEKSFDHMHHLFLQAMIEENQPQSLTINETAVKMAEKFAEENKITIQHTQKINFDFFGLFNSESKFATVDVVALALQSCIAPHVQNDVEWTSMSYFAAMAQCLVPVYLDHQYFQFLIGYICSHTFGCFLALVKNLRSKNATLTTTLLLPSVERYRLNFSNGESIPKSSEHSNVLMDTYTEMTSLRHFISHVPSALDPLSINISKSPSHLMSSTGTSPYSSTASIPSPKTTQKKRKTVIPAYVKKDLREHWKKAGGKIRALDVAMLAEKWKSHTMTEARVRHWFSNNRRVLNATFGKGKK